LLNRRLKAFLEKVLPGFLLDRLDPVQAAISRTVRDAAGRESDGSWVLDAGAGESRHREFFSGQRYIALDSGRGDPSWDYSGLDILGDVERLPFRSGSIDCVLCLVVLEHTRRPAIVLEEFARVLRPGGTLQMIVPFLWEEHQEPRDFFRFTRYGIGALLEGLPFASVGIEPLGGFFQLCGRRCINLLGFFQHGWRWPVFVLLAPFFGLLFPLIFHLLDGLDRRRHFTLGFRVRAEKVKR